MVKASLDRNLPIFQIASEYQTKEWLILEGYLNTGREFRLSFTILHDQKWHMEMVQLKVWFLDSSVLRSLHCVFNKNQYTGQPLNRILAHNLDFLTAF